MEQELEIIDTLFISPSPPPPLSSFLPLSGLDSSHRSPFRTLRLYSPSSPSHSPSNSFLAFAAALSKALHHFYPLAGTLPHSGALAVLFSTADTVPLTLAASPGLLASFQTEPGSDFLNRLAPDLDSGNVLALQLTRFVCGSLALGMCVHHAMCDGAGAGKFLATVAGFARGADHIAVEPVWDRPRLLGPRSPPCVALDFGEFLGFGEDEPYSERITLRECFHVSEVGLNRFRNRLTAESGSSFTAFEALTAFIWRARVKSSGITMEETVKFVYSMNIAKLLNPALPDGYWGNVTVPVFVKLTVQDLLQQSVCETAKLIKKSKHDVTDEYVRSYLDFLELHHDKGITAGRAVSGFTDWRHLGHSEADFGWGSPNVILPLTWRILGSSEPTYFLPYAAEDARKKDGFKVLVCLRENAMAGFRSEMEMFA